MVDWSRKEVDLVVDAYFTMLRLELGGESYSKAGIRRQLMTQIQRSEGSIEFKMANVSAALIEVGGIPIEGYKPRRNIQHLLRERVADHFDSASDLRHMMMSSVSSDEAPNRVELGEPVDVPDVDVARTRRQKRRARFIDYQELEARNRRLGRAGEESVVRLERRRLQQAGAERLAREVRHVAVEDGDGLGYDVQSFDLDGRERFIEVKTTRSIRELPFLVTRNEVAFSAEVDSQFSLYRLFHFGRDTQGFYVLPGSLERTARLEPALYSGVPAAASS